LQSLHLVLSQLLGTVQDKLSTILPNWYQQHTGLSASIS